MMKTKERIQILVPELDLYFQALVVFPSARVDARWGTTGKAHCIEAERLYKYVVEKEAKKRLRTHDIERIAQAFKSLAEMDEALARSS